MDSLDDSFAVEERTAAIGVEIGNGFFFRKRHTGVVESPEFFEIGDNVAIVDNFLDIALAGGNLMAFDEFSHFLKSQIVTFDAGAVVDSANNGVLLELFFVSRDQRGLVDDSLGGFNQTDVF